MGRLSTTECTYLPTYLPAVWLVRGCLGRLMVSLVCVASVALLPLVASPNAVCVAGTSVSVLVSCVLACPSVV